MIGLGLGLWGVALASGPTTAHTWILEEQLLVQVRPPLPVGWVEAKSTTRWVVTWTPGQPEWVARLCGFDFDPVMGAQTTWPDAAVAAVPPLHRPVSFVVTTFQAGPVAETVGDHDDDGDGHPGVTVRVAHPRMGEGEVYVRQTSELAWTGTVQPDGSIAGTVEYTPEQEQLGASTWWLKLGLAQRAQRKRASTFTMVPAPGATCAQK
ncbi:MAG: hypothetical protein R3F59_07285 [Myxococcota bacterium]